MDIRGRVLNVDFKRIKEKDCAQVIIKSGDTLIEAMLWENQVKEGMAKGFSDLVGKEVYTSVNVDLFKGRINYSFPFGLTITPLAQNVKPIPKQSNA